MTTTESLDSIVDETLLENEQEDTNENRLAALLELQQQWDDSDAPFSYAIQMRTSLAVKISSLQAKIRLNLD